MGSTDARVAALDARLELLDERLDDQYDRVSAIDHTLGATDTKLGAIANTLSATDTRIGVAEAALVALLRPQAPQIPAPREASRDDRRDGSKGGSRDGSRICRRKALAWGDIVSGMSQVSLAREYAEKLDADDPLAGFRDRFTLDDPSLVYLNGNSLGALPRATVRRLEEVIREEWGTALARSWDHWVDLPGRAGDAVGRLTGAAPGQVLVADNTTVNLYKLACAALDARPGRRVIVTDQDNFPSDRYVLEGIAAQRGAELRMLNTDIDQGLDPGAVRAAVDEDTALVSLSHVAYRSGALADMAAVTEIVHQAGALMLWDLCHSVGAVPVELDRCDVDLAVGCTYKYVNAGPGAPAFLYVSARLREVLRQPIWGWFSQRDQFAMGPRYDPAAGIAKFMTGTPSIPGTAAVEEGARLLLEAGLGPMRVKSQRLTSYLIELGDTWLEPLGCALATPRDDSRRGGHVTYRHPQAERLVELLAAANIITDYRTPDRLRFGLPPLTTRFTDVWIAVTATRDIIETERCENHG